MQLPTFLMGSTDQVRKQTRRFLDSVVTGEHSEVTLVDAAAGAVILLGEPLDSPEGDRSFHMYLPLSMATKSRKELRPKLVDTFLRVSWGPLAMMGEDARLMRLHGVLPEARWTEFLAATLRWWHEYASEPLRYTMGFQVDRLWELNTALTQELRRRGITVDELRQPLPGDSLETFMRQHGDMFSDVLDLAQVRSAAGEA
jgi:hypothetical protein